MRECSKRFRRHYLRRRHPICAVAGEGGVGIVRVSGSQAFPIASNIVRLRCGKSLSEIKPYQLYLGKFLWDHFQIHDQVQQGFCHRVG